jgi:SNF2 family DNA or RNA helicase
MKMLQSLSLSLPDPHLTPTAAQLMAESGKLALLQRLLRSHKSEGHRTLVFSQSKIMLNLIQVVLDSEVRGVLCCAVLCCAVCVCNRRIS